MGVAKNVIRGNGVFRPKIIDGKSTWKRNHESRREGAVGRPREE